MIESTKKMLRAEEGYHLYPYDCKTGKRVQAPKGRITIGIGRNLEDKPLSENVVETMLREDILEAYNTCSDLFPDFKHWKDGRQIALMGMAFQLGDAGLRRFKDTIKALNEKLWDEAARCALDSKWAREDSPARAKRMSEMIRTGDNPYK